MRKQFLRILCHVKKRIEKKEYKKMFDQFGATRDTGEERKRLYIHT